ncbi:MAG: hypothetical protein J2P21_29575 [Chloracidobacterium sp.]|nr:hypothetical protein [Chloracidobacterium sp.]
MIHYMRVLAARLRGLFRDRSEPRELDDEIEAHLSLLTERYVRQGMSEDEAARTARRQFGDVTLLQEVIAKCVESDSSRHSFKICGMACGR